MACDVLQEEFGEDIVVTPLADAGTTGNFEVTVDGTVRRSAQPASVTLAAHEPH
eukprot:COSAG02_NODE_174_length_31243_cov_76.084543_17_plen_54_part_00